MFPQQGPYGVRCSVSRANGLFIHLYLLESPKRSPPTNCERNGGFLSFYARIYYSMIAQIRVYSPGFVALTLG
jgi:hypothetical protein